jgi:hypothetical protein
VRHSFIGAALSRLIDAGVELDVQLAQVTGLAVFAIGMTLDRDPVQTAAAAPIAWARLGGFVLSVALCHTP